MDLRFLLDEDTESDLADYLAKAGYDVERVVTTDELGEGSDDTEVMAYARRTDRFIVTHDEDYADPGLAEQHRGVFYAPNQRLPAYRIYEIISTIVDSFSSKEDFGKVVILSENWLR